MNNTLVKGLQVLEALARADRPLGVSDLASRLAMGKSNVHRLLQALVELRFAHRDDAQGTYRASLKVWELGSAVMGGLDIKAAAMKSMQDLLANTRETVYLSALDGDEVVFVHRLDSPEPVRAANEIGIRAPAHCTSTGKAIIAWLPEERLAELGRRLKRCTNRSIVEPKRFLHEMEKIRAMGYAVNRGEWHETVWGVAAPIRDPQGHVIASIGSSWPSGRIKESQIKPIAAKVLRAAAAVAARLARRD